MFRDLKGFGGATWKWLNITFYAGTALGALAGSFAGFGLGVATGLLVAPRSGKEFRGQLKRIASNAANTAYEQGMELKDKAVEVKGKAEKLTEKAMDKLHTFAEEELDFGTPEARGRASSNSSTKA